MNEVLERRFAAMGARVSLAERRGTARPGSDRRGGFLIWHRVLMNTEQSARAMQHVVFLD